MKKLGYFLSGIILALTLAGCDQVRDRPEPEFILGEVVGSVIGNNRGQIVYVEYETSRSAYLYHVRFVAHGKRDPMVILVMAGFELKKIEGQ